MRFNGNLEVDFAKWTKVSMERENNLREFKGTEEELPKYKYNKKPEATICRIFI